MLGPWTAFALFLILTTLVVYLDRILVRLRTGLLSFRSSDDVYRREILQDKGPIPLSAYRGRKIQGKRAQEAVLDDLISNDPARIRRAQMVMETLGGPVSTTVLLRLLKGRDPDRARRAAELLYRTGDESVLPHLMAYIETDENADQVA